jgi:hypothetical protein
MEDAQEIQPYPHGSQACRSRLGPPEIQVTGSDRLSHRPPEAFLISREQVAELSRASARYMRTAIGNWIGEIFSEPNTSGVTDPAAASVTFVMSLNIHEETHAREKA